jgi:hypothetical protein
MGLRRLLGRHGFFEHFRALVTMTLEGAVLRDLFFDPRLERRAFGLEGCDLSGGLYVAELDGETPAVLVNVIAPVRLDESGRGETDNDWF